MHKVVDSNYLRRPALRQYLATSTQNIVVLTDYAAMEAHKGNTLVSIYNSMAILAAFPAQVVVLKNTLLACGLSGRGAGLRRRFIDARQTKDFGVHCRNLLLAKAGDAFLQKQLVELGREATQHLDERMIADARSMPVVIEQIANGYTKAELSILRTAASYSDEMIKKLIVGVLHTAVIMFEIILVCTSCRPKTRCRTPSFFEQRSAHTFSCWIGSQLRAQIPRKEPVRRLFVTIWSISTLPHLPRSLMVCCQAMKRSSAYMNKLGCFLQQCSGAKLVALVCSVLCQSPNRSLNPDCLQ